MDRHLPDDEIDRALLRFFAERQDELLATAPPTHLVSARIAATVSSAAARRRPWGPALLVALLLTLVAAAMGAVVGSGLLEPSLIPADRGIFTPTGSLSVVSDNAKAVRLRDGRVLVVGGWAGGDGTSTAEVYDPRPGTFEVVGTLPFTVEGHQLTLLGDGRVLFTGGSRSPADGSAMGNSASADIWDPATTSFAAAAPLVQARSGHTTILLRDGRVLAAGGLKPAEILRDPTTGVSSAAGWPETNPAASAVTLLEDGRVLLVDTTTVHVWDPVTNSFGSAARLIRGRVPFSAITLRDGRVAVISDCDRVCVDIWEPATDAFTDAGSSAEEHHGPSVTMLPDGRILVAGGGSGFQTDCVRGAACTGPTRVVKIWDPASGAFDHTGSMDTARWMHTATLLQDGRVLVAGGNHEASAELFELRRDACQEATAPSEIVPDAGSSAAGSRC